MPTGTIQQVIETKYFIRVPRYLLEECGIDSMDNLLVIVGEGT